MLSKLAELRGRNIMPENTSFLPPFLPSFLLSFPSLSFLSLILPVENHVKHGFKMIEHELDLKIFFSCLDV